MCEEVFMCETLMERLLKDIVCPLTGTAWEEEESSCRRL